MATAPKQPTEARAARRAHRAPLRGLRGGRSVGVGTVGSLRALGAAAALAAAAGLGACQGPEGVATSWFGGGELCSERSTRDIGPVSLFGTISPLQDAFDEDVESPRIIALLPHVACENGARVLREEILDPFDDADLRLYVVWQDVGLRNDRAAALRASSHLRDPRVTCFHDASGLAGRAFARGKLPVAEAREVFLFYPAGVAWPRTDGGAPFVGASAPPPTGGDAPDTESWVHRLGRFAPERFCTPRELPRAMRDRARDLIEQAAARRGARPDGPAAEDRGPDDRLTKETDV
ncbi:MAG: hypothetical protein AAFU73_22125 [Planctomycetota bacterium]